MYLSNNQHLRGCDREAAVLSGRLPKSQINGTGHCASVKPPICIYSNSLSSKFLQIARLVDRFEKRKQALTVSANGASSRGESVGTSDAHSYASFSSKCFATRCLLSMGPRRTWSSSVFPHLRGRFSTNASWGLDYNEANIWGRRQY